MTIQNLRFNKKLSFFILILSMAIFVSATPNTVFAYTYNIKLSPASNLAENYVGRGGFFASDNVYRDYKTPRYNFTFLDNMIMKIDSVTGNATVTGTMRNGANANDLWAFDLNLTGLVFKDNNGQFFRGANKPYDQMINDILAIPSAFTNQQYGRGGYGIEWVSSQLTIRDLNSGSAFSGPTTYVGKNDPAQFHPNVAELHNWQGRLYFGAWWMGAHSPAWFADSKAWGTYLGFDKPPVTNPVPEPTSLALLGVAAGLGAIKRKRSKKS